MKELLDKIAEYKEQMRALLDKAETEKRSLTADEQEAFDALSNKKDMMQRRLDCQMDETLGSEVDMRAVFAENVTRAVESGQRTSIELRASAPLTSASVADTIPIVYKDVLDALTPALVLEQLGVPMQTNVQGEPLWPTVAGIEATIEGENAEVADSTLEFGKIKASPKRLAVSVPVSRRAFNQSNLNLYGIVTKQIGLAVAKTLNKWFFNTVDRVVAGTTGGAFNKAADVEFVADAPTFAEIVELETTVMDANVDATGVGAYIVSPSMAGRLKSTPIEAGSTKMILENGEMNGYPVKVTNLVPAGHVLFGFFDYAVISEFGRSELILDPYTGAKKNQVNFVLNGDFDQTILRPEAFAVGKVKVAP
ncbi:phage major capsid protein [Bacteroides sedimenti]|uniref:Major capsid protein n=1 Tax=Bacteroides sedimenti TaxID=2136147 RepID=A0ABN6Z737_9BACE